ncbi:tyrosine-type recombinase/integrase [Ovoidimarina sediminis]|uniref:tyrosine-type recombinase/integrase n=1 Tax=Ovoidimarina sediminis TaxID=3079856 RepID=UPI0029154ADC|nr:site-specific integrase [Rhodophyticola sp. MJ-SS7]MDU8946446.1 site-specific integrase [Rhodophyticola sp. MJ-SS7]
MALCKQAKTLNKNQISAVLNYLAGRRNALRNQVIFLLSVKAGLRAKEIAYLRWEMVLDADGALANEIALQNEASKGKSGRRIPLNKDLRAKLARLLKDCRHRRDFSPINHVIRTERADRTSPQAIVNMFSHWYRDLGLIGCSSHSGRRTFITNAARKITTVGGSLRDVQYLAGHSSLQTTELYIEHSENARRSIVDLI